MNNESDEVSVEFLEAFAEARNCHDVDDLMSLKLMQPLKTTVSTCERIQSGKGPAGHLAADIRSYEFSGDSYE